MLKIVLHEPSRLLAEAFAFELRAAGHSVHVATRRDDVLPVALRELPDLIVVADLLDRDRSRWLAEDVARGVQVPVLVVAEEPETGPGVDGAATRAFGVVGNGRSLSTVLRAVEDVSAGKAVHEPDPRNSSPRHSRTAALTPREREVVSLLARGTSTRGIATELRVSLSTARTYVQHVLQKLGAHSRIEAVSLAGLPDLPGVAARVPGERRRPRRD